MGKSIPSLPSSLRYLYVHSSSFGSISLERSARVSIVVLASTFHSTEPSYIFRVAHSPLGIRVLLRQLVLVHVPRARRETLAARQWRQAVHEQVLGNVLGRGLLQSLGQAGLSLLLGSNELLLASLADELDLGLGGAADGQQGDGVGLVDDAELGVRAAGVALEVSVVGDVTCGHRHGVIVGRGLGAGSRVAVVRVEGNTVGAVGVNGEELAEALPDTGRLDRLLLY